MTHLRRHNFDDTISTTQLSTHDVQTRLPGHTFEDTTSTTQRPRHDVPNTLTTTLLIMTSDTTLTTTVFDMKLTTTICEVMVHHANTISDMTSTMMFFTAHGRRIHSQTFSQVYFRPPLYHWLNLTSHLVNSELPRIGILTLDKLVDTMVTHL